MKEEITAYDLPVTGRLPADLNARYLRLGPNPLGVEDCACRKSHPCTSSRLCIASDICCEPSCLWTQMTKRWLLGGCSYAFDPP
ncbi:hypothetical protein [Nonomuraea sp. NPDC005650]|uniref:hypothetical protein n=1 Tax=Nonomuraea sp. NPDC005650 TaxID=3157045 RepID=UPI00339DD5D9